MLQWEEYLSYILLYIITEIVSEKLFISNVVVCRANRGTSKPFWWNRVHGEATPQTRRMLRFVQKRCTSTTVFPGSGAQLTDARNRKLNFWALILGNIDADFYDQIHIFRGLFQPVHSKNLAGPTFRFWHPPDITSRDDDAELLEPS